MSDPPGVHAPSSRSRAEGDSRSGTNKVRHHLGNLAARGSKASPKTLRCRRTDARKWKEEQLAESYDATANDRLIVSLGCHRTPSAVWDGAPACATIVTGSGRLGSQGLVSPGSTGRMGRPTARTRPVPARYTRRNWIRAGRCRGPCGVPQSPRRVAPAFAGRCRGRSGPRRRSGRS